MWKLEWQKNAKNRIIWIMMGLMFLALPGMVFIGDNLKNLSAPIPGKDAVVTFPHVWDFLAYNGSWQSFFFLGFLSIYLITSEYGQGTVKQNIIQGLNRRQFFTGKLQFIGLMILITFIYFLAIGLLAGYSNTEVIESGALWGEEGIIWRYLLMSVGYSSFAIFIAFLIRKTGPALLIYFSYILFLEPVWRWLFHKRFIPGESQYYYPMNVIEDLCPLPFYKLSSDFIDLNSSGLDMFILSPAQASIFTIIYTTLFIGGAYYLFQKRDL